MASRSIVGQWIIKKAVSKVGVRSGERAEALFQTRIDFDHAQPDIDMVLRQLTEN